MSVRVAIAMAVYNDSRYLRHALDMLAAQTFRDFHLTVVDDGSTDDSAAVVESYSARIPLTLHREPHRGRHDAKQASWQLAHEDAPYLMVLDSDMELPPDCLSRMVGILDQNAEVAGVSAQQRSVLERPWGQGQAFLDDVYLYSNTDEHGNMRWLAGGSMMVRRAALASVRITGALGEDNEVSKQLLEQRWRVLGPRDLKARHHGVPTTLWGVIKRAHREGIRVRSLLRVYPDSRQLGNVARLVPLPIVVIGVAGLCFGQVWLTALAAGALVSYLGAFLWASRDVPASLRARLSGALLFAIGNLGFAVGYVQDSLRGGAEPVMREPNRSY
jgi:glycosyltransferase involved in cell wall biosynthesis